MLTVMLSSSSGEGEDERQGAACCRRFSCGGRVSRGAQVQEAVHGVTMDECQAALHNHSLNVQKAVHYLKVRAFKLNVCFKRLVHCRFLLFITDCI